MNTTIQQQIDSNGQIIVTSNERQALIQKLTLRWPLEISTRIENQLFDRSQGIKSNYIKLIQGYFHQVQTVLQNRANQQHQQINTNITFPNSQQTSLPIVNQVQHSLNQMHNQSSRFPIIQQTSRINNSQANILNQMLRLRDPQKSNQTSINTLSYSQSPITTIDLSEDYSSEQINNINQNDYSSFQSRFPIQSSINVPKQQITISNNNFQQQQSSSNNTNDILHQFVVGNSSTTTTINTNNSSTGDQLLQRILMSNIDGGSNKISIQNRQVTPSIMSRSTNLSNSTNTLRSSLSPSPSVVIIPTPTQTSTVQIQPSNNIIIQQSPLSNSNAPFSVNSQTVSTNNSTPILVNYSSPTNRTLPLSGSGNILSPDNETLNLIKYLKENINRLQLLCQKFTNEGNTEKVRQIQLIHQQIIQFINNPTYESLVNAKHFRDMLDRIPNRLQQINIPLTINIFNQCIKAINEFLLREQKQRINITKRYLEPLTDVINGVPHKIIRLDIDNYPIKKIHSYNQSSLLSNLNDEINQLPIDIYFIELIKNNNTDNDNEYLSKNGIILRCKLLEKLNPIIPILRLHITTSYPEQPPEILSLTKTMPPRLEFADGHPFFDQISSVFVSYLFKLRPQHTVTDILNIWRQSVQTAL